MNTSPITTWEGAAAYFTFADKPAVMAVLLIAAIIATAAAIVMAGKHESASYKKVNGGK